MRRLGLSSILALGVSVLSGAAADQSHLMRLVHQDCGACHGMTLKGGLGPDIRPDALSGHALETVRAIILDGVPGTAMPPWRPLLTEAEVDWIAAYLLTGEIP